jgi:Zn-dependent protease
MLPLPPLDGGRVLVGLLPQPLSLKVARIEPFGFVILIVLLMTRTLDHILDPMTEFLLKFYLGIL